jgi:hypothetical protein
VAVATLVLAFPRAAGAVILPATTIDGPSQEIVGAGGVAMAEDGTGGVVYLKRVGGVPHVFVSRFIGGRWLPPIRVDTGEQFAASWPRIGAANDGELIVVWATAFATENEEPVDELVAAELGPASSSFGPAIIVDPNIQDATGTSPDLAVSSTGQADVVYRVVRRAGSAEVPPLRPGDVVEQVRLAHFNGQRWTNLGAINRAPGLSMRPPTEANAPKIAIGPTGNGAVVWQEPEINGVARIWARRLFGASLDFVLPVSAPTFNGVPLVSDADAPSVAISTLGQGIVAYRQSAGPGSPLSAPRIFLNTLPDGESQNGAEFLGASLGDTGISSTTAGVGPPSIDLDERRETRLVYDAGGAARVIEGNDQGLLSNGVQLGPRFAGGEQAAVSVMNPEGGGFSAWPSANAQGDPAVALREDFQSGAVQTGLVSGGAGGEVSELSVGRSGLGDGLIAFRQGPLGNAAIVAAEATAPPAAFRLSVPKGWIAPSRATISWDEAASANGPLAYQVVLDGHRVPTPSGTRSLKLDPHLLGDGQHSVQVLATDIDGQATLSIPVELKIDGQPPSVDVARIEGGHGVSVNIADRFSGVETRAVRVSFGDGHRGGRRTRLRHRYARAGIYQVVVTVANKLGFSTTVRQLVSVR